MFYVFGGWNLYNCILNHTSTGFYIEYSQVIKPVSNSFSKSGHYHQLFLLIFWPRCWLFLPVETRFNFTPLFLFFPKVCKTDSESSFPLGAVLRAVQKQLTTLETQVQSLRYGYGWMDSIFGEKLAKVLPFRLIERKFVSIWKDLCSNTSVDSLSLMEQAKANLLDTSM